MILFARSCCSCKSNNPANLDGILVTRELFPGVPQIAVFDTAYHQTLDLMVNNQRSNKPTLLSNTKSQVQVWGIPTNEELAIAREAQAVSKSLPLWFLLPHMIARLPFH